MQYKDSELKQILGREITRPPFSLDPKFLHLQNAEIGDPVPLFKPERLQESWIVPFLLDGLVCGIALMSLDKVVNRVSVFGFDPLNRARWFSPDYFIKPPEKYHREVRKKYPHRTLSEPLFTYDQTPTRWGWRIQVLRDGFVESYIFINPTGWYVRDIKDIKKGFEG